MSKCSCTHFLHYHGRFRLFTNILVYTDHPHFLFGGVLLLLLANLCWQMFVSKVKVNVYTYNQVHSSEEHVITMELSQEVWCVDIVMCIYTWVQRTHACTNFASKVEVNLYKYNQVQTGHLHG